MLHLRHARCMIVVSASHSVEARPLIAPAQRAAIELVQISASLPGVCLFMWSWLRAEFCAPYV